MATSTAIPATGAPVSGIIRAYRFDGDGIGNPVPPELIEGALKAPDGWSWIHLGLADARCRNWIARQAPLSNAAREVLTDADEHLRLDLIGGELVGVIPDLQRDLARHTEDIVRLRFAIGERVLITARRHPVHSIEVVRRAVDEGRTFAAPISLVDAVIDQFADTVGQLAESLGDELDVIENRVLHAEIGDEGPRLGRLRLQSVRVHRQLAQLRSLFHRLEPRLTHDHASVAAAIRALGQKLDAIDQDVASLHTRARLLLDDVAAKMTATTNRRLFTLSMLTACLLPPTLVTGVFGMNTADLPFQSSAGGTWLALLLAAAAGALSYGALTRLRAF